MNRRLLGQLVPGQVQVEILRVQETEECTVEESELDEMWSYVKSKDHPRWLWHAIDRSTGQVLAYVFGARKDEVFLQLKALLKPFGIKRYCPDGWGAVACDIYQHNFIKWANGRLSGLSVSIWD